MRSRLLQHGTMLAIILALLVVMLGAYTRLTDAGLGCPDWPGCYGQMVLPDAAARLVQAQQTYPNIPIEAKKAWTEMAHRYAAGSLALLIVFLACLSCRSRREIAPWILVCLVAFQAALGMWTVTLKLLPVVVMSHLLGGILIFATLCYFRWQVSSHVPEALPRWRIWVGLCIILIFCQIALGGWVSSNYAGIACIGFPRCNGSWLPTLELSRAFHLFSPADVNYQGGLLDNSARITIQFVHRVGALITATYVLTLSSAMMYCIPSRTVRLMALSAFVLIIIQFILGIINVLYLLPLWVAVAHNGVAALLLGVMVSLRYLISSGETHARSR